MNKEKRITSKLLIFVSPTCHPCHKAISDMKKYNIQFEEVDVNKNPDLVKKYYVRSAPTFVGLDPNGNAHCIHGYQNIKHLREVFNI